MMRKRKALTAAAVILFLFPAGATAGSMKGKIQSISMKAKAIEAMDLQTNKPEVILFGEGTRFENADSIKDFIVDDVILVDFEPGAEAKSIKRMLIEVAAEKLIDTKGVESLLRGPASDYLLVDARPQSRYDEGHLPTAVSIPVDDFEKRSRLLPKDKNGLIVFYCGGPT